MFVTARRDGANWRLATQWGLELSLPGLPAQAAEPIRFGTVGTRFDAKPHKDVGSSKTGILAGMLRDLGRPVVLIDTRRDGVGAQSSWSPREFASLVPDMLGADQAYSFIHLPLLAPSLALLDADRKQQLGGWRVFCERYRAELGESAIAVAQAFVEAAAQRGGLALFMCAEPFHADFERLAPEAQDNICCHRFPLSQRVATALKQHHPGVPIERLDLDAGAWAMAKRERRPCEPRIRRF